MTTIGYGDVVANSYSKFICNINFKNRRKNILHVSCCFIDYYS